MKKTYVTSTPDKAGAFLKCCEIITAYKGNITRVSYNKAVDLHTLFIDVEADANTHQKIEKELSTIGYVEPKLPQTRVVTISIRMPDQVGALLPVLKILQEYTINIPYLNSVEDGSGYQNFIMGLFIERPSEIKQILDAIANYYPIDIIDYGDSDLELDNTVFYLRLAKEMQKLMHLSDKKTMEFISDSNRILQMLQKTGEQPQKVFEYIRNVAHFIVEHQGKNFTAKVDRMRLSERVTLYTVLPPCGSNTYVFDTGDGYTLMDAGFAIYHEEMMDILTSLFPDFENAEKTVYISHADMDHLGLLPYLKNVRFIMNKKSKDNIACEYKGIPDSRRALDTCLGYTKIIETITGYIPIAPDKIEVFDKNTPDEHGELYYMTDILIGDIKFSVYEGNGGHLKGEMIYINHSVPIVFTGDSYINIEGFTEEQAEFNSLAPYLMTSVDMDPKKARALRKKLKIMLSDMENGSDRPLLIAGGHAPIAIYKNGTLHQRGNSQECI